jgi:hypothetical protein
MDIKRIEPLNGLSNVAGGLVICQMSIGNFSPQGSDNEPTSQPIKYDGIYHKGNPLSERSSETNRIGDTRNHQKYQLKSHEGWIISRPMILGLFSVVGRLVHHMRAGRKKSLHLIQSTLKIHLSEIDQSREVLRRPRVGRARASRRSNCLASCRQGISSRRHSQAMTGSISHCIVVRMKTKSRQEDRFEL